MTTIVDAIKHCAGFDGYGFIVLRFAFDGVADAACLHTATMYEKDMARRRLQVYFSGRVQGVGFRFTVKSLAAGFDATGTVRNLVDGRVEFVAEGETTELEAFLQAIRDSEVGRFIRQEEVDWRQATDEFHGFEIVR